MMRRRARIEGEGVVPESESEADLGIGGRADEAEVGIGEIAEKEGEETKGITLSKSRKKRRMLATP